MTLDDMTGGRRFVVVVGSGGVGKTTLAASLALASARAGQNTLVMTFDPSLRLKDALGVGNEARERDVEVDAGTRGTLRVGLLDARRTFDRLVARYAPDEAARDRILKNRFYQNLAGNLAGILEYMAVERLYEVSREDRYDRVFLDTPPTRQALDFLEAPERIVSFLDSGALRIALRPWFDEDGNLRATSRLGFVGRRLEGFLDRVAGLDLLRDMAEFFQVFAPLFDGFRERAIQVQELLRSDETGFLLVASPGEDRIPDAMFFARRLSEAGHVLLRVLVNRVHPRTEDPGGQAGRLLHWLGERDHRGLEAFRTLLPNRVPAPVPLLPGAPTDLEALQKLADLALSND